LHSLPSCGNLFSQRFAFSLALVSRFFFNLIIVNEFFNLIVVNEFFNLIIVNEFFAILGDFRLVDYDVVIGC
jgi:hypothetical protein